MKRKITLMSLILVATVFFCSACSLSDFLTNFKTTTYPKSTDSAYSSAITIDPNSTATQIAEALLDSCVTVMTITKATNKASSFGSGVCVYAGGYIATNYHVVSTYIEDTNNAYKLQTFLNGETIGLNTQILWYNSSLDVAIVQCEEADIPYVSMKDRVIYPAANDKLRVLESVIAIGTPIDFSLQNWCTIGTVAKLNTYTTSENNLYECLIGHTSAINHGNSGGGLFDMKGQLIGLNTLGNEDANSIFFAVPIYPIINVIQKVVSYNEQTTPTKLQNPMLGLNGYDNIHAYIFGKSGLTLGDVGLFVESVVENGSCGSIMFAGDIVLSAKVNEKTFEYTNRYFVLCSLINSEIGDEMEFSIKRGTETITRTAVLKGSVA